jgi:uncharacterized protein
VFATELAPLAQETCNTYNMLKLTEHLFTWQASPQYADFFERALINHILATPNPDGGSPLYYLGLQSGQWKVHFIPNEAFFCCAGSGLENFAKLGEGIYFHNGRSLWVNLFFASELNWREKSVVVRQETRFPEEAGTRLIIRTRTPVALSLNVRIPYWTDAASFTVNGQPWPAAGRPAPSSYATIDRTWKDGDRVDVKLPMRPRLKPLPDDPGVVAIMYGPLVLAAELGTNGLDPKKIYSDDKILRGGFPPMAMPKLVGGHGGFDKWLQPVKDRPLTFRTVGVGKPEDVTLSPLYRLFNQRYNVYWRLRSPVAAK